MAEIVVGIDLGTTNSLIGAVVDGTCRLFADPNGTELLPSVVSADPSGAILVGRPAKNRRLMDPTGTVVSIKRLMGQTTEVRVGTKNLSPPQVSALILGALLDRVEKELGARPTRAVITVPAYFDDSQRQATRDAGEMAGLAVERLVNEPTAAAMTYQTGQEERVLVYDLGGGTFDVSILDRDEGFLEVKASRGDTHLGGDDIDEGLTQLVLERLGTARAAIDSDPRARTRLVEAVERAKIALSDRDEVRLFDPFLAGEGADAVHLDVALTRDDVEKVARPFLERTLKCIDDALRDAHRRPTEIDRVLLVGGSSKMPVVRQMVSEHLGRPAQVDLDADRAVALGASLLAGRAAGAAVEEILVDITPHTLAIGALSAINSQEDVFDHSRLAAVAVIPRDTVVPVERTERFATVSTNQTAVIFPVVQGEEPRVGQNTLLGEVEVGDLPPSPAHSPVDVTFRLDLSGVLNVLAKHVPSGRSATVIFSNSPYRLTEQRRRSARAEVEKLREKPVQEDAVSDGELQLAKAMVARAKRALEKPAEEAAQNKVREALTALELAIENPSPLLGEATDALSDALLDLI